MCLSMLQAWWILKVKRPGLFIAVILQIHALVAGEGFDLHMPKSHLISYVHVKHE